MATATLSTGDMHSHALSPLSSAIQGAFFSSTLNVYTTPMPGVLPLQKAIAPGALIRDLVPESRLPWVCVINGVPMKRDYWMQRKVYPGDVIDLHVVVQGGKGGSKSILAMVAMIAIAWAAPYLTTALLGINGAAAIGTLGVSLVTSGITLLGSALVNAMVSPGGSGPTNQGTTQQSSTYNVALSGNQARLGGPIPVGYGRMLQYPDFAAQPYMEYVESEANEGDQFYYALFCIGHGNYNIERVSIEDTDINNFADVQYRILPPGTAPTMVHPAVVSAPEVSGQTMLFEQYIGAFSACGPKRRANRVDIDVVCQGLGVADSGGNFSNKTIDFRVEYREIDDWGLSSTPWLVMGTPSVTAATSSQVRRTFSFNLSQPARVQVRVVRTSEFDDSNTVLNEMMWVGLRSYLDNPAPLCATATHMEVKIRASEQLSGMSQRKISVIRRRLLRTWAPETGWGPEVETRSIAWALADKWTNPVYGDGLPDNRCDLQTLHELDQVWAARQDRLDIIFDTKTDSLSADQVMASAGRATVFRRNGVRTIARDAQNDLPVTAHTSRTILPGSTSIKYIQVTEETADGVIVEYFDNRAWDWLEVDCPAPGVTEMANPVRVQMPGITGKTHAEREGLYQAAANVYRRKYPTWQTEMQGALATFGAPVVFAPALQSYAQSGDVAFYDEATRVAGLTEPVQWTGAATHRIRVMRPDGSVTDPIACTPGPTQFDVTLAEPLDFAMRLNDAGTERPRYVFGPDDVHSLIVKLLAVTPQGRNEDGAPIYTLSSVIEDNRVHAVDNHLLPAPGEIQDPVDPGDGDSGGGGGVDPGPVGPNIVTLTNHEISGYDRAAITVKTDGRLEWSTTGPDGPPFNGTVVDYFPGEWMRRTPIEAAEAALYEVRAVFVPGRWGVEMFEPPLETGEFGTWFPLTADVSYALSSAGNDRFFSAPFTLEIREISTGLVQASSLITLQIANNTGGGGN